MSFAFILLILYLLINAVISGNNFFSLFKKSQNLNMHFFVAPLGFFTRFDSYKIDKFTIPKFGVYNSFLTRKYCSCQQSTSLCDCCNNCGNIFNTNGFQYKNSFKNSMGFNHRHHFLDLNSLQYQISNSTGQFYCNNSIDYLIKCDNTFYRW